MPQHAIVRVATVEGELWRVTEGHLTALVPKRLVWVTRPWLAQQQEGLEGDFLWESRKMRRTGYV